MVSLLILPQALNLLEYAPFVWVERLEQASEKEVTVTLKLIAGPLEISLSSRKAKSLLNDYKAILQAVDDNVDLLKNIYDKLGSVVPKSLGKGQGVSPSPLAQLSVAEMLKKSGVKKDVDRIFLTTYYLFEAMKTEAFNRKDVDDAMDKARLEKPTNLSATLNQLVGSGRLKGAGKKDGRKAFTITQTGEEEAKALLSSVSTED
jgi:hypothetical protein